MRTENRNYRMTTATRLLQQARGHRGTRSSIYDTGNQERRRHWTPISHILEDPHEPDFVDYLAPASAASEIGFHNSYYTSCIRQHHTSGKGQEKRKSQEKNKIKRGRVNLDVHKTKEPIKN